MSNSHYFSHPRQELVGFLQPGAKRILDVGCGAGTFSAGLKKNRDLEVWGLEIDKESAAAAATRLDKVIVGDAVQAAQDLPMAHFDCIFCNDILEHLVQPEELLGILAGKIAPGGRLVASVPNVRYFWTVWDLLVHGRWDYCDEGILDRTHLRFFTRSSMQKLFNEGGYRIVSQEGIHPIGSLKFKLFNLFSLGFFRDMKYLQFVWVLELPDR